MDKALDNASRSPMAAKSARPLALLIGYYGAILSAITGAVVTVIVVAQQFGPWSIQMQLPVATFWPTLKSSVHVDAGPTAQIMGGGFEQAQVSITGLSLDVRVLLAGGHLLQGLTTIAIATAFAILCSRLIKGDPFRPVVSRTISVTAAVIAIGGIGWQICLGLAGAAASMQVLNVTGWEIDGHDVIGDDLRAIGWPDPTQAFTVDGWPIYVALVLIAVAAVFHYGEKLQGDNEKLQRDKRKLQRDTEGLV